MVKKKIPVFEIECVFFVVAMSDLVLIFFLKYE